MIKLISNLGGKIINIVSLLIGVPLILRFLGIETYGLIAFSTTLAAILATFDLGITQLSLNQLSSKKNKATNYTFFRSFELVLFVVCCSISFIGFILADNLVNLFFLDYSNYNEAILYYRIFFIEFSFQLLMKYYFFSFLGIEKHGIGNIIFGTWALLRNCIAPIILIFYSNIISLIIVQILFTFVILIFFKVLLEKNLRTIVPFKYCDWELIKSQYRISADLFLMSIIALVNLQMDKFLFKIYNSTIEFGYYSIAVSLCGLILVANSSYSISTFERIKISETTKCENQEYVKTTLRISLLLVIIFLSYVFFLPIETISLLTNDPAISQNIVDYLMVLSIGFSFASLQYIPYYLTLKNQKISLNNQIGVMNILIFIILILILTPYYDSIGIALSFSLSQIITTVTFYKYTSVNFLESLRNVLPNDLNYFLGIGLIIIYHMITNSFLFNLFEFDNRFELLFYLLSHFIFLLILLSTFFKKDLVNSLRNE